jgi:hypothetical protein
MLNVLSITQPFASEAGRGIGINAHNNPRHTNVRGYDLQSCILLETSIIAMPMLVHFDLDTAVVHHI